MNTTKSNKNPIISKKTTHQSDLFRIDTYKLDFGSGIKTHEVVYRNPTISVFPLTKSNELYLVKQYRYLHKKITLEAMAGFVDSGETPLDAAKRELIEETGLSAKNWKKLTTAEVAASVIKGVNHMFVARNLTTGKSHPEEDEDIELVKLPFGEAIRQVKNGTINHSASMIGILLIAHKLNE